MTMRIEGMDELNRTLLALSPAFRAEATKAVNRTAQNVRNDAVRSIQRPSAAGETYVKANPRREHVASAPGEPPNTDTGRLVGSIRAIETGTPSATVEAQAEYARHLEFGTRNMAARPFLTPAVESNRAKYEKAIEAAVKNVIKGAVK